MHSPISNTRGPIQITSTSGQRWSRGRSVTEQTIRNTCSLDRRGAQTKPSLKNEERELYAFVGIEHRLTEEAADQVWIAYARKGYKLAAAEERSTEVEDAKHTSGGVLHIFAVDFWHTEGLIARNEVLLEAVIVRTRDTPHPG